jgi:hypothetical protein
MRGFNSGPEFFVPRRNGIFREFLCAIVALGALKNQRIDGIALYVSVRPFWFTNRKTFGRSRYEDPVLKYCEYVNLSPFKYVT